MPRILRFLARIAGSLLLTVFLTAAQCGESAEDDDQGEEADATEEESTATDRLKEPRNVYDGNVNENLQDLESDLEGAGTERQERLDEQMP